MKTVEGRIPYAGFETFYRIAGENRKKKPLVTLHGGPGAGFDYLTGLDELTAGGRAIVYYDQIGCGRSPADSDPSRWTPEFFAGELNNLIDALKLDEYHLLGQSWGGMLALIHASERPRGLRSLILADVPVSIPEWLSETRKLIAQMPEKHRTALEEGERSGDTSGPAYAEALGAFMKKHMIRTEGALDDMDAQPCEVYLTMWGQSELAPDGTMRDTDLTPLLKEVNVPTLVLSGRYDQCTSAVVRRTLDGIAGSRSVVFENSGHIPNIDEKDAFNDTVEKFLQEVEADL